MKTRPIPFSGPMVRSVLDGSKTQTRRVVKWRGLEPGLNLGFSGLSVERSGSNFVLSSPTRDSYAYRSVPQPCPYGAPGDRLWVREAWSTHASEDHLPPRDCSSTIRFYEVEHGRQRGLNPRIGKLRPSMFMPRWHSRITLEVTGVRVERLQDISDVDAVAEGIGLTEHAVGVPTTIPADMTLPRAMYRALWEQINGPGSWDANPWVWVVEFRRAAAGQGGA